MLGKHLVFYLGSKVTAAGLNLAAVAVFARLAGPAIYGEYLVAFAWAYVVYGCAAQWLRFAFFAGYRGDTASEQISAYLKSLAVILALISLVALGVGWLGILSSRELVSVMALVVSIAIYDGVTEIGRTRLLAEKVAQTVILRAIAVLALGALALEIQDSAPALAIGVALGHVIATAPLVGDVIPLSRAPYSVSAARGFLTYGWPLIAASGVTALGQNLDRLMLAAFANVGAVGAYGATSDLIKQSMFVLSEAILGAYIPIAKKAYLDGDLVGMRDALKGAFLAYTAIVAFGAAFIGRLGLPIINVLLGHNYGDQTAILIPFFVAASGFLIFRSFYFGQVIYFIQSSMRELITALATIAVVAGVAWTLVPSLQAVGAGMALLAGHATACILLAVLGWRRFPLPIPVARPLGVCAFAGLGYAAASLIALVPLGPALGFAAESIVLGASFIAAAVTFDLLLMRRRILHFAELVGRRLRGMYA